MPLRWLTAELGWTPWRARMLQAKTGWPRPLCNDVGRSLEYRSGVRFWLLASMPLALPGGVAFGYLLVALLPERPPDATIEWIFQGAVFVVALVISQAPWFGLLFAIEAVVMRRAVNRFLAAPRCFKCKYPIPPPREGRSYSICPECGEPIAPEIARLAARDAEATERISE